MKQRKKNVSAEQDNINCKFINRNYVVPESYNTIHTTIANNTVCDAFGKSFSEGSTP